MERGVDYSKFPPKVRETIRVFEKHLAPILGPAYEEGKTKKDYVTGFHNLLETKNVTDAKLNEYLLSMKLDDSIESQVDDVLDTDVFLDDIMAVYGTTEDLLDEVPKDIKKWKIRNQEELRRRIDYALKDFTEMLRVWKRIPGVAEEPPQIWNYDRFEGITDPEIVDTFGEDHPYTQNTLLAKMKRSHKGKVEEDVESGHVEELMGPNLRTIWEYEFGHEGLVRLAVRTLRKGSQTINTITQTLNNIEDLVVDKNFERNVAQTLKPLADVWKDYGDSGLEELIGFYDTQQKLLKDNNLKPEEKIIWKEQLEILSKHELNGEFRRLVDYLGPGLGMEFARLCLTKADPKLIPEIKNALDNIMYSQDIETEEELCAVVKNALNPLFAAYNLDMQEVESFSDLNNLLRRLPNHEELKGLTLETMNRAYTKEQDRLIHALRDIGKKEKIKDERSLVQGVLDAASPIVGIKADKRRAPTEDYLAKQLSILDLRPSSLSEILEVYSEKKKELDKKS